MIQDGRSRLYIQTPEGVTFALRLAGPVVRFLAFFTDVFCILAITKFINAFAGLLGLISHDISLAFSLLSYFAVSICYGFVMEWYMNGQTLGKRLLQLRVMDAQGLSLTFSQVVIRNLLRFVDALPAFYLAGGAALLLTEKNQRLGDLAANTIVVWSPALKQPDFEEILSGKFNSFREYPHLCARLRQNVSPAEADIVLDALLRRENLEPAPRIELFKTLANHFRSRVPFPEDSTFGLSDEQYIRNIADVLFRRST